MGRGHAHGGVRSQLRAGCVRSAYAWVAPDEPFLGLSVLSFRPFPAAESRFLFLSAFGMLRFSADEPRGS